MEHHSSLESARKSQNTSNFEEKEFSKESEDLLIGIRRQLDNMFAKVNIKLF
jgi:hypothetical protein